MKAGPRQVFMSSASLTLRPALISPWTGAAGSAVGDETNAQNPEMALAALVEQYAPTLYRVAYSVLRNVEDAEDAVQEAFLRVLRHQDTLGEVRDHRVWLIRIVWNIVLDCSCDRCSLPTAAQRL